jgi:hypothetical protein
MWRRILEKFGNYSAQLKVVKEMVELGLSVRDGKICCRGIDLSSSSIARATGVDRRAIAATIEAIEGDDELREIFSKFMPTSSFKEVAPILGWGVIEIVPTDPYLPGILARVSDLIARRKISIRQAIADDPELKDDPRLFIITEEPIPLEMVSEMKGVFGVKSIVIY